jgi:hypothetical protein
MSELRVKTESGSTYILNQVQMTWDRERNSPEWESPFPVRTKGGTLMEFPEVVVGQPLRLFGPSLTPGGTFRMIETSLVVGVEEA